MSASSTVQSVAVQSVAVSPVVRETGKSYVRRAIVGALTRVPEDERWRGCAGVALVPFSIESMICRGARLFVRNDELSWCIAVDVPNRNLRLAGNGVTTLSGRCVADEAYGIPRVRGALAVIGTDAYGPVGDRVDAAMTSTALAFRKKWAPFREAIYGEQFPDGSPTAPRLLYGPDIQCKAARPGTWMPDVYLGFEMFGDTDALWAAVTGRHNGGEPYYSEALRASFCEDLLDGMVVRSPADGVLESVRHETYHGLPVVVFGIRTPEGFEVLVRANEGVGILPGQGKKEVGDKLAIDDVLGYEDNIVTDRFRSSLPIRRWETVQKVHGDEHEARMRIWLERQIVRAFSMDGRAIGHLRGDLAECAAQQAVVGSLIWDLNPTYAYYVDAVEAFIPPTLQLRTWDDFQHTLKGVTLDLTPACPEFRSRV